MLAINNNIQIPDAELNWSFVRSGGPGGQNVNKVASKAVLRWNVAATTCLPDEVKERLRRQQRRRVTEAGELILSSQRFRDQGKNVQDCLAKLRTVVLQAVARPKPRKPTRPTRGSKEARLRAKRHRSGAKQSRRQPEME
ncbi:MAG: alternative ribosome rescue aminoacyl-tRNA hydrolase ArfB [Gemmataceae bacterium]